MIRFKVHTTSNEPQKLLSLAIVNELEENELKSRPAVFFHLRCRVVLHVQEIINIFA